MGAGTYMVIIFKIITFFPCRVNCYYGEFCKKWDTEIYNTGVI